MSFLVALELILAMEGGPSDDPRDPGGYTRHGISQTSHPDVNVGELSVSGAADIYRRQYWDRCKCDSLPGGIALLIFDSAVNLGPNWASRQLQRSLGVKTDGIIGPITIDAAIYSDRHDVIFRYTVDRLVRYASLETWGAYSRGWTRRAMFTMLLALELEKGDQQT